MNIPSDRASVSLLALLANTLTRAHREAIPVAVASQPINRMALPATVHAPSVTYVRWVKSDPFRRERHA